MVALQIIAIDVHGETGVEGPLVWLLGGELAGLRSLVVGQKLTISCRKAKEEENSTTVSAEWTCHEEEE